MEFYKLQCCEDTKYPELYRLLEVIGNFIIDEADIMFFANKIKKSEFTKLNSKVIKIDPTTYKANSNISKEWIQENYRKFRVESPLKEAEEEKQEDLQNLYSVIKAAEEIIDRKEDLVEKK